MTTDAMSNYRKLVAESEEKLRQRGDAEKIQIQVGSATCENAAGAAEVMAEFRKYVSASGRKDIVLRKTGCTGRCSREPIVTVFVPGQLPVKYERINREVVHEIFTEHVQEGRPVVARMLDKPESTDIQYEFMFCGGPLCGHDVENKLRDAFQRKLHEKNLIPGKARIVSANCFGLCMREEIGKATYILVRPSKVLYRVESEGDLDEIIREHVEGGRVVERLVTRDRPIGQRFIELYGDLSFFNRQTRVALRNAGIVNPEDLTEYLHYNGFEALAKVLERNDPRWVIDEIGKSNLRGRGGAGFPTATKWANALKTTSDTRYIICNADEGDPGAFMDRDMLESDPFAVIEGITLGGFAIGAHQGFFYIRAEYPMAIKRVQTAINLARKAGLLGENILGSAFSFDLEIRLGAGAFVCGEETSLINSIQGERGEPRIRPPYPTQEGLWGHPTVINNVETLANVPAVLFYGADWFRQIGTAKSGGTKVFALAGKVRHTGLVEVPMGSTLREIIFNIGGGVPGNKQLKAVQTGGPAGGCIPADAIDTVVDYETLTKAGSIMGSGGMIVMDEDDCMVDIARYYIGFNQDESCGKCTPCREGTMRMLEIFDRIVGGEGTLEDLNLLERLGNLLKKAALCGLGRAAPNPVLSTLKNFRKEYEAHVIDKVCPTGKCPGLKSGKSNP